jgi:hypothetical protein
MLEINRTWKQIIDLGGSDKLKSLLHNSSNWACKKFYGTGLKASHLQIFYKSNITIFFVKFSLECSKLECLI